MLVAQEDNQLQNLLFSNLDQLLNKAGDALVTKFITVGEPPRSNLTPAQVQSGQTGAIPGISQNPQSNNKIMMFAGIGLLIVAVLFFVFKRK